MPDATDSPRVPQMPGTQVDRDLPVSQIYQSRRFTSLAVHSHFKCGVVEKNIKPRQISCDE